jgi:Domain of unknown function (DUF4928)
MTDRRQAALTELQGWYDELRTFSASGGAPARGTVAAALWVLERLKGDFDLDLTSHLAEGGAQIKGVSPTNVQAVLERFGETRPFLKEGGRTNRGVPGAIRDLLRCLDAAQLASLPTENRVGILDHLQQFLVDKVREYHGRERIKPVFNRSETTRQFIDGLLEKAKEVGKRGPVAQHLVGAKLALRFPEANVRNESFSAADDQSGQPGDFHLGDTVFHVTVAPSRGHYDKCKVNLQHGRRVYLLVCDDQLIGTRQIIQQEAPGQVTVESVESFVAQKHRRTVGIRDRQS